MKKTNYNTTRFACFFAYLSMSSVFVVPSMLFMTFHEMYDISYTLLGSLVLINFFTQMVIDLIFTFFAKYFNIKITIRIMPLLTSFGMMIYALIPTLFPQYAYVGLITGTIIFSVAAGLSEVLLSPTVAAIPSEHPDKDMSLLHSLYGWGVVSAVLISSVFFLLFGTENWKYLIFFLALLPLIASTLFHLSPIPPMQFSSGEKNKTNKNKIIALCAICIFLGSASENSMTNWISSFMEKALQIPKAAGDILGLAIFATLLAVTRIVYAKYTPNITKTLLFSMIGAAACYLITGLSGNVVISFIACILIGLFTSMLWPGTLILMEEKIHMPGVAAYALMAACGDMGASAAPQLLGAIVDKVSASDWAMNLSTTLSLTTEQIGMKTAMILSSVFPIIGILLILYMMRFFKTKSAKNSSNA